MVPAYTLILILLTPNIAPGASVDIQMFVVGFGEIDQNKIKITYPPNFPDKDDPGYLMYSIAVMEDSEGMIVGIITGDQYLDEVGDDAYFPLTPSGAIGSLNKGYFLVDPTIKDKPDWAIPRVLGEVVWDDYPPLLIHINTPKDLKPGNYEINVVLTYSDGLHMYQDSETVVVHVKNLAEIWGFWVAIIGLLLSIWKYRNWINKKIQGALS